MTEPNQTEDAREAEDMGEKPDLGRKPDALTEALSGSGMGSDTRAGSLQGGASSGSDIDPDQDVVNETLAREGRAAAGPQAPPNGDAIPVRNTGEDETAPGADKAGEADAATG